MLATKEKRMLHRPRRNRKSAVIRDLVRENRLDIRQLIYPLFIVDGTSIKEEIESMPGNYRWSLDLLLGEIESCLALNIKQFILFPIIADRLKDKTASYSYSSSNYYLKAINT